MRTLTYYVAVSLDGFISGPGGEIDAYRFDGAFAQEIVSSYPETLPVQAREALGIADAPNRVFDTILMGRTTYDPALELGITSPYPQLEQVVFSSSLDAPDPAVRVVSGDPVPLVRELKARDGLGIWLCGGANLAGQLLDEIDELIVKRNPIVLGSGVRMFDRPYEPKAFTLVDRRQFEDGLAFETYRPVSAD
jgi:dihydrofolate reductase